MKNKEKYNLGTLKTDSASCGGKIKRMMVYEETSSGIKNLFEKQYKPPVYPYELLVDFANWLEEEYVPNILTDKEEAYLSAVIKPFREEVESIKKIDIEKDEQQLQLQIPNGLVIMDFPLFKKGAMYRGMEEGREYTLEELGL